MRRMLEFTSIRKKMTVIFTVLLTGTVLASALLSMTVFNHEYETLLQAYLEDVARQTTNNLEFDVKTIEDKCVQILSNPTIQRQLKAINTQPLTPYELQLNIKSIQNELNAIGLYDSEVVSVSVISLTGVESAIKKEEAGGTQFGFGEDSIYGANGTSLWTVVGAKKRVCIAKAILSFETMKPLGYINIVVENHYFGHILEDNSTRYSKSVYVVDEDGKIVIADEPDYPGTMSGLDLGSLRQEQNLKHKTDSSENAYYYIGKKLMNGWTLVEEISVWEFTRNSVKTLYLSLLLVGMMSALGFTLVRLITGRITKPTQELLDKMKVLGREGTYPRVDIAVHDEIGQIGMEYNRMADYIETLIERVYKMELAEKQAEIEFLQMQINPHFLYNALDTISWMAIAKGESEISDTTVALAELLRATIIKEAFITLREEAAIMQDYLLIQKQRFGDKISYHSQIDPEAYQYMVPAFLLQPLIENAIIHGLEPKLEKGELNIRIWIDEERLFFDISDNGVGMRQSELEELRSQFRNNNVRRCIGLKNVYRRLLLCYGEGSILEIESGQNQGTRVSFSIPLETQTENNGSVSGGIDYEEETEI